MNYVLLLRGINVGGKHKVSMPLLKESLSQIGFANVSSYINSGNLFLESEWNDSQIIEAINSLFEKEFDFPIPFLLLSNKKLLEEAQSLPSWWYEDFYRKNVLFFLPSLTSEERDLYVSQIILRSGENLHIGAHALFWGIEKEENYVKSYYHAQFLKNKLYKHVSVRNHKTFQYLVDQK